jgi:hypothetical protein
MKKFTYKDIKTGKKVFSDVPIKDENLRLVAQVRDGKMKANKVTQK